MTDPSDAGSVGIFSRRTHQNYRRIRTHSFGSQVDTIFRLIPVKHIRARHYTILHYAVRPTTPCRARLITTSLACPQRAGDFQSVPGGEPPPSRSRFVQHMTMFVIISSWFSRRVYTVSPPVIGSNAGALTRPIMMSCCSLIAGSTGIFLPQGSNLGGGCGAG
eukprot:9018076-Pyramimonas_sp.AAC.1